MARVITEVLTEIEGPILSMATLPCATLEFQAHCGQFVRQAAACSCHDVTIYRQQPMCCRAPISLHGTHRFTTRPSTQITPSQSPPQGSVPLVQVDSRVSSALSMVPCSM